MYVVTGFAVVQNTVKILLTSNRRYGLLGFMRAEIQRALCALIGVGFLIISTGCGGGDSDSADQMGFVVVDSLLGPDFTVPRAGKQLNPPRGFTPASDSVFAILQAKLQTTMGPDAGWSMVGCFLDSVHPAGLVVSVIDTLNLTADTGGYFTRYGNSLRDVSGGYDVREGEYWVRDVFVKNYLVTDSMNVQFHLLCLSESGDALELMYFAPRIIYPRYIKHFESSIGSLKLIKQGE